jgi:tRNA A-37 threonylcarbamoyl transferase component Bud32
MGELTMDKKKETMRKYYDRYYKTYFTKYGKYIDFYVHKYFPKGGQHLKDLSLKSYESKNRSIDESLKKMEELSFRKMFQRNASKPIPQNSNTLRLSKSREFIRFMYDLIYRRILIYEIRDMIYKHIPDDGQMHTCLKNPADAPKMEYIGGGEYGKIFKIDENRCVKFINISEVLHNLSYIDFQNEVEISKIAGELGVGPKIYDTYVCVNDANSTCYGIIYMEYVKGVTLTDFLYKYYSKGNVATIRRLLEEKINKLHNAGILHSDLHSDNVMVIMQGSEVKDVVIIDFGFSQYIKDYIYHRNHHQLNDTIFHFSRKYIYGEIAQTIMKKLNL